MATELINVRRISAIGATVAYLTSSVSSLAIAQQAGNGAGEGLPAFPPGMIDHMQAMRRIKDPDQSVQQAPPIIPRFEIDDDPAGAVATFRLGGATFKVKGPILRGLASRAPYFYNG